jgi:hypothetical protein
MRPKMSRKWPENGYCERPYFTFAAGDLVLVRNTEIESSLDKKMKPRYTGPMIVISRSRGGAYVLAEMDGAVFHQKIGAFRVIPYFARKAIQLPENVHELIDISKEALKKIEDADEIEREVPDKDFAFDGVRLRTDDMEFSEDEMSSEEDGALPFDN